MYIQLLRFRVAFPIPVDSVQQFRRSDPVKAFEGERSQKGTAAWEFDTELKLRTKADRKPVIVMFSSYKYPGGGMF